MNEQNLIPMNARSQSEARELGRKGGIASGEARRERAKFRELFEVALEEPYFDVIEGKTDMTNAQKIVMALIAKAQNGDVKAFAEIRNSVGEMPVARAAVAMDKPSPEAYAEVERLLGLSDDDFDNEVGRG